MRGASPPVALFLLCCFFVVFPTAQLIYSSIFLVPKRHVCGAVGMLAGGMSYFLVFYRAIDCVPTWLWAVGVLCSFEQLGVLLA